jgi:deazaflavin-dependent oxidoreductase (nitroreductase family)
MSSPLAGEVARRAGGGVQAGTPPANQTLPPPVVEVVKNETKLTPDITKALSRGGVIDITTQGAKSGKPRRIEIVFHNIEDRVYVSGMPGFPRGWLANLKKDPSFTFHLKGPVSANLPATARVISADAERRQVLPYIAKIWKRKDLDKMVETSPLIEVSF